jgi:hypothetical protein
VIAMRRQCSSEISSLQEEIQVDSAVHCGDGP